MKKLLSLTLLFLTLFLFAEEEEIDTSTFDFEQRQVLIQKIKKTIQHEESIAKAYEVYLLENYKRPADLSSLSSILGVSLDNFFSGDDLNFFKNLSLNGLNKTINYRLTDIVKKDTYLKSIYESDTFRKKTFVHDGKIHITLNENFAKNIYNLIISQNKDLVSCDNILSGKYCIKKDPLGVKKDHVYIYETAIKNRLLMYYYPNNYEKGPIMIIDDISYYTEPEFLQLPIGTLLYDFKGEKYLKTRDSVRKVN